MKKKQKQKQKQKQKKKTGVPPRQSSKVRGWLPPPNIWIRHFEKYLHGMVLKLSGHVRNTISLLYKQKTGWNSDIWNFCSEKIDFFFNFGLLSLKIRLKESGHVWKRHCDVIRLPIVMILVSMERRGPTLYHGTKQLCFGPVNFKFIGVVTTPLGKPYYKKRLGRTRVKCLYVRSPPRE